MQAKDYCIEKGQNKERKNEVNLFCIRLPDFMFGKEIYTFIYFSLFTCVVFVHVGFSLA